MKQYSLLSKAVGKNIKQGKAKQIRERKYRLKMGMVENIKLQATIYIIHPLEKYILLNSLYLTCDWGRRNKYYLVMDTFDHDTSIFYHYMFTIIINAESNLHPHLPLLTNLTPPHDTPSSEEAKSGKLVLLRGRQAKIS